MPILATPELGIPLPFDTDPEEIDSFRDKAHAMFRTIEELAKQGLEVEVTDEDRKASHAAFIESKPLPVRTATAGAIVHLESMLNEWDQEVLDVGRRLRNYVTNKLLLETADPDPKIRLKSLELLGKISSVGLFSERVDVTVTHRTVSDIEKELRKTLELFTGEVIDIPEESTEQQENESSVKSVAEIDLNEEFGEAPEQETQKIIPQDGDDAS